MASNSIPMTFSGTIVNFQIIHGGNPTINNFPQPSENPGYARSTPYSSDTGFPPASNSLRAPPAVEGSPIVPTLHDHRDPAAAAIPFPTPHLESSISSASQLSSLGSSMENLHGFHTHASIAHNPRQSIATEGYINRSPSTTAYARSNMNIHFYGRELVGNNLSRRDGRTANMHGSTQSVSFPNPHLPPDSFPGPSVNRHVWFMPEPDRCDWFIDEREDGDYSDEGRR